MELTEEQFAQITLARTKNVGPVAFAQLLQRFGSAKIALTSLPSLKGRNGKRPEIANRSDIQAEIKKTEDQGAQYIFFDDDRYPELLRHLSNPPPLLIAKGNLSVLQRPAVGIVGARNSSAAARKFAHHLGFELANSGFTVVSGLARGIDSEAHKGAVSASQHGQMPNIPTVGVIASGIDIAYPQENRELQDILAIDGLVVTEYPPGSEPVARHFPFRNRIIAGLSLATLVVEAAPRSGSLITARLANELGREVLAIPGSPLDSRSAGCNGLIREGATLVRGINDIVEAISPLLSERNTDSSDQHFRSQSMRFQEKQEAESKMAVNLAEECNENHRDRIRNQLSQAAITPDDLSLLTKCPVATVNAILVELEVLGECERIAGGRVKALAN